MIRATFSNGYTRTYKGKRDVRAAWAIIDRETGETLLSGFSLDADKARKTADGNVRYTGHFRRVAFAGADRMHWNRLVMDPDFIRRTADALRQRGVEPDTRNTGRLRRQVQDVNASALERARRRVDVEIVTPHA